MRDIIVYGRGEQRIGQPVRRAKAASPGADIEVRPFLRPGELLEATPGLIATQHSGGGKANQFFLRGFNLDHGTDYALYIDDMPMNFRTHGHGQGYLDVQRADPRDRRAGRLPQGPVPRRHRRLQLRRLEHDHHPRPARAVRARRGRRVRLPPLRRRRLGQARRRRPARWSASSSSTTARGSCPRTSTAIRACSSTRSRSAWASSQASLNVYNSSWAPTEQIPERAIGTALCEDRYCTLDRRCAAAPSARS